MSEPSNGAWPFQEIPEEEGLDISAIFGDSSAAPQGDPFAPPAAAQSVPSSPTPVAQEITPAVAATSQPTTAPIAKAPVEAPAENPIAAAFEQKTAENTKKGLLEKPPVFYHKGVKEEIDDPSMTFEELRIRKSDDFTDLEEGKRVSWSVEYCGIRKEVKDPKGTTIISMKEMIERSREFLDALKKTKDKDPCCYVKPKVEMKTKGNAAYKGKFGTLEEARNSDKVICLIPSNDGRIYELRKILNPLYFIEELGEDGKKLLERYLPTIPHETVLSQLSEPVREHLKNETILSPEGSLKRCREEIRSLEERITYLRGQKDLAASQGESHEQAEQEVTLQADLLRREIAELEQRQFSSMDVSAMQERLVELSGRYEEAARDERADTSKLREQLQLLREKIARREVEKYQSKFTEALAEASARVKDLGVRYQRENAAYKAFHAGMECPACHRSVTEQSLPEVQAALKKVLSELYAAGSEQRAQLIELQEMDKKAADTFAQFKEDDLGKWAAEAAEMEQRCASLAEQASAETERLRAEIQTLTADLEYGNLSQSEYDHLGTCREELRQSEAKIAALQTMTAAQLPDFDREIAQANASIAEIKRKMANVIAYISKRAELTFSQLKMNRVEISLYDVVKSTGEVKDTFKFQYGGRRYDRLSLSEKIRAGMEVSELMKRLTGRNYPVFVDNMESVDDLANVRPTGQIIMAKCVSGAALQVKPIRPIAFAEQRAA